jgi:hypothetical protein
MRVMPSVVRHATTLSIGLALLLTGCATMTLPQRYPNRPPAGLGANQAEQDQKACLDLAGRAVTERAWGYIGCMVSKGHSVSIGLRVQEAQPTMYETHIYVAQTRPHEVPAIATELEKCRNSAYGVARSAGGGTREARDDRIESAFRTCVDPLGYVVQRAPSTVMGPPRR